MWEEQPEATRRGSKRATVAREGRGRLWAYTTSAGPTVHHTGSPRGAYRPDALLSCTPLATVSRDPARSNFVPVRVGPVASELGRAAEPQAGFQADG